MTPSPHLGGPNCRCEECLTALIRTSAVKAASGRDLSDVRARLDGLKRRVTVVATPDAPRSAVS
jgi:hypothetical protein